MLYSEDNLLEVKNKKLHLFLQQKRNTELNGPAITKK